MASHLAFARGVDWNANFAKPIEPSVQAKIAGSAASRLRVRRRALSRDFGLALSCCGGDVRDARIYAVRRHLTRAPV
jgi:hypothetical protein